MTRNLQAREDFDKGDVGCATGHKVSRTTQPGTQTASSLVTALQDVMSKALNRGRVIGVWVAVLAVVAGAGAVGGVSITLGTRTLLLVACLVPPAIMLMVWRGAAPPTV